MSNSVSLRILNTVLPLSKKLTGRNKAQKPIPTGPLKTVLLTPSFVLRQDGLSELSNSIFIALYLASLRKRA